MGPKHPHFSKTLQARSRLSLAALLTLYGGSPGNLVTMPRLSLAALLTLYGGSPGDLVTMQGCRVR